MYRTTTKYHQIALLSNKTPWRAKLVGVLLIALGSVAGTALPSAAQTDSQNTVTQSTVAQNQNAVSQNAEPIEPIVLSNDGGWCWYQDERAIVNGNYLLVATIASGTHDPQRQGDLELIVFDLNDRTTKRITLHDDIGYDDHNVAALKRLPNGRILAIYATHGRTNAFWYRLSQPNRVSRWAPSNKFVPSERSRITYSNVFCLRQENNRIYNFYRGYDNSFKPSYAYSDDLAQTWKSGGVFIDVPTERRHRPYVKYCSDGEATIHMVYTEGHPRVYDNSLYHVFYRNGDLHQSDGNRVAPLAKGLKRPEQGSRIYQGGPTRVAWSQDLHLDANGQPVTVFSVQRDAQNLPYGHADAGQDHRYHYARWNGQKWEQHEIAHAGTRLYPGEDDYTGLIVLDPNRTDTVYISTDAHPITGKPLISDADGKRHYEIFKGVTDNGGQSFSWTPVTKNSTADNIRPIVPKWDRQHTALLWLRGTMRAYTDYNLDVMAKIDTP